MCPSVGLIPVVVPGGTRVAPESVRTTWRVGAGTVAPPAGDTMAICAWVDGRAAGFGVSFLPQAAATSRSRSAAINPAIARARRPWPGVPWRDPDAFQRNPDGIMGVSVQPPPESSAALRRRL